MGKKFTEFVNKMDVEAKNNKNDFNPAERIDAYRKLVNSLYADIDYWLSEELGSGKIQTGSVPITITEELLGAYTVDEKWIQIGNARIQFHPVGTILIGTNARVDMIYGSKDVMIIRVGENVLSPSDQIQIRVNGDSTPKRKASGKKVWKYVKEGMHLSYIALNKDSFEDLIIDVVNGNR